VDFAYTPEDEAFRAELTGWLDENLPKFLDEWADGDEAGDWSENAGAGGAGVMRSLERRRAWQRKLHEGRWAAIHWPRAWGGREATVTQSVIYSETLAR
jgi:alkylation response protein AidB-like acyl-CoA dehydrogenase